MRGGILDKARRGDLITPLPVGLAYDTGGHVVLDPDQAVRKAVTHLFATFADAGSAHAVVKAFADAGLLFPRRHRKGPRKGELDWAPLSHSAVLRLLHNPRDAGGFCSGRHRKGPRKGELDWAPLSHSAVLRILHNPRYAGAFCFGRHREMPGPDGKTCTKMVKARQGWISFLPGAHAGYITLAEFEASQARLSECAAAHGGDRKSGPAREGPALLQGLIICGRCGQRMTVRYHLRHGAELPDYLCQKSKIEHAGQMCQQIPGAGLDNAIGQLLIDTLMGAV